MRNAADSHRILFDADNLPHLEVRDIPDARNMSFNAHTHSFLELAILVQGKCTYTNGRRSEVIVPGTTTIMNPEEVHACVPDNSAPLAFRLYYFDVNWAARIQDDDGQTPGGFSPFASTNVRDGRVYRELERIFLSLADPHAQTLQRECHVVDAFASINRSLQKKSKMQLADEPRMARAAEFISDMWSEDLKLEDIGREVGLSNGHLIRSFKKHHGMSPYSYLINRRVQIAREMIKQGTSIVDAAYGTGFYDQAHFHKAFKRLTGVTPGEFIKALEPARLSA